MLVPRGASNVFCNPQPHRTPIATRVSNSDIVRKSLAIIAIAASFHGGGAQFHDPRDLFSQFFGTSNPFAAFGGGDEDGFGGMGGMGGPGIRMFMGGMPGMAGGGMPMGGMGGGMGGMHPGMAGGARRGPQKAEPIKRPLQCTLEELYTGACAAWSDGDEDALAKIADPRSLECISTHHFTTCRCFRANHSMLPPFCIPDSQICRHDEEDQDHSRAAEPGRAHHAIGGENTRDPNQAG